MAVRFSRAEVVNRKAKKARNSRKKAEAKVLREQMKEIIDHGLPIIHDKIKFASESGKFSTIYAPNVYDNNLLLKRVLEIIKVRLCKYNYKVTELDKGLLISWHV
jgi:hypothetical protein